MDMRELRVDGVDLRVAAIGRDGPEPIVFLHGFGSTKEDHGSSFPTTAT